MLDLASLRALYERLAGVDDGELFLEYRQSEGLSFDDGVLKTASFDTTQGAINTGEVTMGAMGSDAAIETAGERRFPLTPEELDRMLLGAARHPLSLLVVGLDDRPEQFEVIAGRRRPVAQDANAAHHGLIDSALLEQTLDHELPLTGS